MTPTNLPIIRIYGKVLLWCHELTGIPSGRLLSSLTPSSIDIYKVDHGNIKQLEYPLLTITYKRLNVDDNKQCTDSFQNVCLALREKSQGSSNMLKLRIFSDTGTTSLAQSTQGNLQFAEPNCFD